MVEFIDDHRDRRIVSIDTSGHIRRVGPRGRTETSDGASKCDSALFTSAPTGQAPRRCNIR